MLDTIDEQLLRKQGLLKEQVQTLPMWLLLTGCTNSNGRSRRV